MTSHLSNLLESFSHRNHMLGTLDFTDLSSEHFLEKTNKQKQKQNSTIFYFGQVHVHQILFTLYMQLFVQNNTVVWSCGKSQKVRTIQKCYTAKKPVLDCLWSTFDLPSDCSNPAKENINTGNVRVICLIIKNTVVITCWSELAFSY